MEMLSQERMKSVSRKDVTNMLHFAMTSNLMFDGFCNIDKIKKDRKKIK